jgi:ligand-binding sensor domain-containing protein
MKKNFLQIQVSIFLTILFLGTACNPPAKHDLPIEEHPKLTNTINTPQFGDVRYILQDKEGNLWFGTRGNGLYKYDGKSFKQFTVNDGLNSNKVFCILEDKEGKIWIGTEEGLCLYDGKTITQIQIPLPENLPANKNPYYQNHWVFSMIQAKSGKIWFATIDGVYIYDGKSFTHFPMKEAANGFLNSNAKVERMLEDKEGNIWLGGRTNEGVFRYDGKSITHFKLQELIQGQNGLRPKPHSWGWPQLQDKNGNIWFSNWGGVYRYDGKTFTSFSAKEGLTVNMVAKIIEDKKGNFWIHGDDPFYYDGKSFTRFTAKDKQVNIGGWSILEDRSGIIWVGTRDKGLYIFDGKEFITYSEFKQ